MTMVELVVFVHLSLIGYKESVSVIVERARYASIEMCEKDAPFAEKRNTNRAKRAAYKAKITGRMQVYSLGCRAVQGTSFRFIKT